MWPVPAAIENPNFHKMAEDIEVIGRKNSIGYCYSKIVTSSAL